MCGSEQVAMSRSVIPGFVLLAGAVFLAGCQDNNLASALRQVGAVGTPDEFLVLPTRPLEIPQDMAALPPPKPGTSNLVDYHPHQEALASLTGSTGPLGTTSGAALVASAPPAAPQIRTTLAAENVTYRQENKGLLLERIFIKNKDALIYRAEILDAPVEFTRVRAAGLGVPSPPPSIMDEQPIPVPEQNPFIRAWRPLPVQQFEKEQEAFDR